MNWYSGSVPDAVSEAKRHNKVFLVYIEGDDDLSKQMTATYNDPVVKEKLSFQNCVALKLSANSVSHRQFSEIYPVLVIPSSFFIGRNGIPLEILTGSLEPKDFCVKLDKVFELHADENKVAQSSQNNSPTSENASPPETSTSPSEGPSSSATAAHVPENTSINKVQSEEESKRLPEDTVTASESTSSSGNIATASETTQAVSSSKGDAQSPSPSQESSASSSTEGVPSIASSSTEEKPSLEDRVERAKALMEERRILKEIEENEKEKREEIERRKLGKALQQAQQSRQDAELKEWAINRAKEKEEERLAKERVRAQIAQDRAERAAKFQQEKARELEALKEKENAVLRAEQERADREAALRSTLAHLQFRLPSGSSVTHQFPADATLEEARQYVIRDVRPSCGSFTLCTTFPRRHFTENNYAETLRDLQLAPTATLLILPAAATVPREAGFLNYLLWTLLTPFLLVWRVFTSWFRGNTTVGRGQPPPPPPPHQSSGASQPGSSNSQQTAPKNPNQNRAASAAKQPSQRKDQGFYRQDGNIFRLSGQQNDDDDNNTWNGNSTQQM